jgi:hypothetical protein
LTDRSYIHALYARGVILVTSDKCTELTMCLDLIKKSSFYGFSDCSTAMEEQVLKMIQELK